MNRTSAALSDVTQTAFDAAAQMVTSVVALAERLSGDLGGLPAAATARMSCGCSRPSACWLPHELPPIRSEVGLEGTARVRFSVRNCGLASRTVFVAATGRDASLASGHPSTVTIGALETGEVVAEATLPPGGQDAEMILWVRGCRDTAAHWTIRAHDRGCSSVRRIELSDCPCTRHHWYDHFDQPCGCRAADHG
jgi:hypothetical protein